MSDVLDFVPNAVDLVGDIAGPYVLLSPAGRSIGGIVPNVVIQESLADENTITQHPVQSGAPISDHVFANPSVVDMVVGWSDSTGGYPGFVQDVYQMLLALRDTRQPFDVTTGKRQYKNMLFGAIAVTTDETSEYALQVRVRLQEIIISETTTAGSGSNATSNNQKFPRQTAPEANMGHVELQPWNGPGLTPIGTVAGGV